MSNGKTEEQQKKRNEKERRNKYTKNVNVRVCVCVWQKVSIVYQLLKGQILEKVAVVLFMQLQQSQLRNGCKFLSIVNRGKVDLCKATQKRYCKFILSYKTV